MLLSHRESTFKIYQVVGFRPSNKDQKKILN